MNLRFIDLRRENVKRCEDVFHPLDEWSATDWGCALAGEVGEACNLIKKRRRLLDEISQPTSMSLEDFRVAIAKELADVVIYADLLAARLNIDLGDAVVKKFNEVSDRRGSKIKLDNESNIGDLMQSDAANGR